MGLLDFFTGGGTRRGANQGIATIQAGKDESLARLGQAEGDALGNLRWAFDNGISDMNRGYDDARLQYGAARDMFAPWAETGAKGFNLYADAIGANGDAGYNNAVASYHRSPGYEGQVTEGVDRAMRAMSAAGALGSGNTINKVREVAQDYADRDYTGWLGQLDNLGKVGYSATGQMANLTKGLGDLEVARGTGSAGLYAGAGRDMANVNTSIGNSAANTIGSASQGVANLQLQKGKASDAGSGNIWGALLGGANLASRVVTAPMNNGSMLSNWLR